MRNNPREILLGLHRRHVKAWEGRNLDEMRVLYAPEAVVFCTEPPARFSDFKTFENNLIQHFMRMQEVTFLTSNIQIEVVENLAWVSSLYLRAFRRNGSVIRESGRWTEVYLRGENEDWQLVHFHASNDPEPEA
ncbi:MAG: nuclear transport factor 2 family protein [Acidobacteriota bacterium]|nr:MAG: nuclear transport factor 2 family protein [Acidobacteriota bacterium]